MLSELYFLDIKQMVSTWNDRLTSMSGLYFSFCPFAGIGRAWFLWVPSVRGNSSTVFVRSREQVDTWGLIPVISGGKGTNY
jgi:hypothetical protein